MEYNTGHTARFLVSLFLNSKDSLKYELTAIDRSILRYLADRIDLEFYISGERSTSCSFNMIGIYSGCSRDGAYLSIKKLTKQEILKTSNFKGSKSTYSIGKVPVAFQQKKDELSTTVVKSEENHRNGYDAYNSSYKLQTYNKENLKIDSKANSQSNENHGIDALHEMAKLLNKETELKY